MHYALCTKARCIRTSKIQRVFFFFMRNGVHSIAYIQTRGFNEKDDDIRTIHILRYTDIRNAVLSVCLCMVSLLLT